MIWGSRFSRTFSKTRGDVMGRSDEFRTAAADCLALINTTTDASSRAKLLTMAQKWFTWADRHCGADSLESILRQYNDDRMIPH
jgi:site-specific recombinase